MSHGISHTHRRAHFEVTIRLWPEILKRVGYRTYGGSIRGRTSGLSYTRYWQFLFDINEHLPADQKMTDYAIARNVIREFPHHKPARQLLDRTNVKKTDYYTVPWFRKHYNTGRMPNLKKFTPRTGPVSFRYNNEGQCCSNHSPTRLLSPEEIAARKEKFSKFAAPPIPYEAHEITHSRKKPMRQRRAAKKLPKPKP